MDKILNGERLDGETEVPDVMWAIPLTAFATH